MDAAPAKQLYEKYGFLIFRTCTRILHSEDDAKDALQAVFLKLLQEYSAIREPEKVVPWIFTAAKNYCFNVLRYKKKFAEKRQVDEIEGCLSDPGAIEKKELIRLVFRNHNKKVRDAVYYTYMEQFTQQEIQRLTGQSPATIRRNLQRFKKSLSSLRKRLSDEV